LIPGAAQGQIFIDLGTITAPQARSLGSQFSDKGAFFLDAPVSGGPGGANEGNLYVFIGGDPDIAVECLPLFRIIGNADHVVYCGDSGSGQIVKGVNQMAMGLGAAAYLEAIAFGVRAGVNASIIADAVGGPDGWRDNFARVARQITAGKGDEIGVKHGQLPYFMEEAAEKGFELPMTKALYAFCEHAEKKIMEANRLSPSFWDELINKSAAEK
jgi:3-hydroxyisobutyrate dehydrogenase-like beta-hydroxyacid dehydrogenase